MYNQGIHHEYYTTDSIYNSKLVHRCHEKRHQHYGRADITDSFNNIMSIHARIISQKACPRETLFYGRISVNSGKEGLEVDNYTGGTMTVFLWVALIGLSVVIFAMMASIRKKK